MADLASVLPILSLFLSDLSLLAIFRFFRCTRIVKLYRFRDEAAAGNSELSRQLALLIFTATCLIFVSSGIVHAIDQVSTDVPQFKGSPLQFHEAFYFLIITVTTVGYGDIHPQETMSRCVIVIIILLALGILPGQVARSGILTHSNSQI